MTPIIQQGVFCVVHAGDVERKTREGWQLVGVIAAEQATTMGESSVVQMSGGAASYQVSPSTLQTTRSHVIQTPWFLLCQNADSALGQMGLQLENAVKTCTDAIERAKEAQTAEAKAIKMRDTLNTEAAELKGRLDTFVAEAKRQTSKVVDLEQSIADRDAQIALLQTKLGRRAQPTAFERLLAEGADEESSLTSE